MSFESGGHADIAGFEGPAYNVIKTLGGTCKSQDIPPMKYYGGSLVEQG